MNTVFFVVVGNEVYVSDYYKETLKQVKFQEKDSWEVYDVYDFRALIEYMNYPLHYKQFQDSQIKIVYTDPKFYNLITEAKDLFDKSIGLSVGYLPNLLEQESALSVGENQEEESDKVDTIKICTEQPPSPL